MKQSSAASGAVAKKQKVAAKKPATANEVVAE
jgi:hypothetical protein